MDLLKGYAPWSFLKVTSMAPFSPGLTGSLVHSGTVQPQLDTTLCTTTGFLLMLVNSNLQLTLLSETRRSPKSCTFSWNWTTSSSGRASLPCAAAGTQINDAKSTAKTDIIEPNFICQQYFIHKYTINWQYF